MSAQGDDMAAANRRITESVREAYSEGVHSSYADHAAYAEFDAWLHPLIRGLLQVLPTPGQPLSQRDRERWLKTLDMNLTYIYPEPTAKPDSVSPGEPTSEQQQLKQRAAPS